MKQEWIEDDLHQALPPEVHLKMALDFLYARARELNLTVTASLIGAAGVAALDELRERTLMEARMNFKLDTREKK